MADAFWRSMARRIRRRLYRYLAAEVVASARTVSAESEAALHAGLAAERDATRDRFAALDAAMQDLRLNLGDHAAAHARLATIEVDVGALRAQFDAERSATDARLAQIERVADALSAQLGKQGDAHGERMTKLELLLEHPEVLAASRADIPFPSPVVTIVTPTWNRGWVVGAAIRSVQAQSFAD